MELMPLGELRAFVRTKHSTLRKTTLVVEYVCQIAEAVQYLHGANVIHRDLAARNILVRDPKTVKVADFGMARYCGEGEEYTSRGGKMPLKWMAPESIQQESHSRKSDIWMFGVCSWEVLSCVASSQCCSSTVFLPAWRRCERSNSASASVRVSRKLLRQSFEVRVPARFAYLGRRVVLKGEQPILMNG
jgi:serine/threonine protein kinase